MESRDLVDNYINELSSVRKERSCVIVDYIRYKFPKAEEIFKYKMPVYELNNTYIAFASQKGYLSFYCHERRIIKYILDNIEGLSSGKGCVRFKDKDNFDINVIKSAIDKAFTENIICTECKKKCCDGCQL